MVGNIFFLAQSISLETKGSSNLPLYQDIILFSKLDILALIIDC